MEADYTAGSEYNENECATWFGVVRDQENGEEYNEVRQSD